MEPRWFETADSPPDDIWWWAVEHAGHPAYYLRALIPGDFAPGRTPAPRHVLQLDGSRPAVGPVPCGTCAAIPDPAELEPYERRTGISGFLEGFRRGDSLWPGATSETSCWECSHPRIEAEVEIDGQTVRTCGRCERHLRTQAARARPPRSPRRDREELRRRVADLEQQLAAARAALGAKGKD